VSPAEPIVRPLPREFPSLPTLPRASLGRPLRVCLATCDIVGPIKNGGIGTAYTALARALAAAGNDVTIAYVLGAHSENEPIDYYVRAYAKEGIRFQPVPRPRFEVRVKGPGQLSYHAYLWLKRQEFDVIHFHEWMAPGYHSILARHQGLAFPNTLLVCETHSPSLWHKTHNLQFVDGFSDLTLDFMERESVRYADVVVSPSHYLLRWMLEQGWRLPERAFVEQNILPSSARGESAPRRDVKRVEELVFFGRLEARKGLVLFCNAIDALVGKLRPEVRVTFLGKAGIVEGEDGAQYARRRAEKWPFPVEILSDKDQAGAIGYLRGEGRVAVVASLVENSPYVVLECLGAGVPFLGADVGGLPELIAPEDRAPSLFAPRASALAQRIGEIVETGLAPARTAIGFDAVEAKWCQWHAGLVPPRAAPVTAKDPPLVSVVLVTHDRPKLLRQSVRSLEAQDYPRFEVILMDDGSREPESLRCLDQLEPEFAARGWRIVRGENRYPGAARNAGARLARGEWLLFQDDDNLAKPKELSTFVAAAERTGAPIITCQADVFSGDDAPDPEQGPDYRWLFLGGAVAAGAVHNCFGDVNALLRKDLFLSLGGFHEEFGVGHEDWELFARAALAGHRIEALPEALFWYRISPNSLGNVTPDHANHRRSLLPYLERVPPELGPLLELAKGVHFVHATVDKRPTIGPELQKLVSFAHALKEKNPGIAKVVLGGLDRAFRLVGRLRPVRAKLPR
jgi:glycosyltransferase involved in cell wall biosynthesis/GT2 family glycosyltransferase